MKFNFWKCLTGLCLCGMLVIAGPREAEAAGYIGSVGVETSSSYRLKVEAPQMDIYSGQSVDSEVVASAARDQVYEVTAYEDGWAQIRDGAVKGYVKVSDGAILVETTQEKVDETAERRNQVVQYALQFVGRPYVWGGTDPHTGTDCSGFTSYVMRNAAGIYLSHSSRAQAGEGKSVKMPKPGDLVFYSHGGSIDHVALYIGNGQIVHASTEKTGIKVSVWNYRNVAKIVDVLSR